MEYIMKEKITGVLGADQTGLKGCYVAGGAITSLFTNKPINDYDVYPKSKKAMEDAIYWCFENGYWNAHASSRALTFVHEDTQIQIMIFDEFPTAEHIFDLFDFTVCMGAFDLDTQQFVLHEKFLLHCSQRYLEFNPKTKFPYSSVWRVRKYEERGFTIGKMMFFKMLMACQALPINSWEEFKEQMGGVYGESITIPEDKPYSFDNAMGAIESIRPMRAPPGGYDSAELAIYALSDREIPYFEITDVSNGLITCTPITTQKFKARIFEDDDTWYDVPTPPKNGKLYTLKDLFPEPIFYKKVRVNKEDGLLESIHYKKFKYPIGEMVASGSPYIYCFDNALAASQYTGGYGVAGYEVIELVAEYDDIVYDGTQPRLKKALVKGVYKKEDITLKTPFKAPEYNFLDLD